MGIGPFRSSSSRFDKKRSGNMLARNAGSGSRVVYVKQEPETLPNPRPDNYQIIQSISIGDYLIVEIRYLDCTNYEGRKILVFKDCSMLELKEQKLIDPHFSDDKSFHSPIARFEPTAEGMFHAKMFARTMIKLK